MNETMVNLIIGYAVGRIIVFIIKLNDLKK
jgi:hypothetical protein